MKMYYRIVFILLILTSCSKPSFKNEREFYKWINEEANGISVTKKINGYKLNVKYLPADYLAYSTLKNKKHQNKTEIDSLKKLYSSSRTFLFTIGPDSENKSEKDIMYENIGNYGAYSERAHIMNFQMGELIQLNAKAASFSPSISRLENIYSLGNQRSLYVVFSDDEMKTLMKSEELDFTYNDELFDTGISHFVFKKKDLDKIPSINFWKN